MRMLAPEQSSVDERGGFWGITRRSWQEANYIETKAGQVRGNHYHKFTEELFFIISGEIDIMIDHQHTGAHMEFRATKGDVFLIEPYELHTFHCRTSCQWINMLSSKLDQNQPDFYRPDDQAPGQGGGKADCQ
jgi:mannose-6-phosphate isomerase-like protein (cupin superfamily)